MKIMLLEIVEEFEIKLQRRLTAEELDLIPDDILIEALEKARNLKLDTDFITILEREILRRKLSFNTSNII